MTHHQPNPLSRRAFGKALFALALSTSALTGFAAASHAEDKTIAVSFPNASTIGSVVTILNISKDYGATKGYKVVVDDPGPDLNKQINTLNTWIEQKVPVIVAVVPQPAVFEAIAKRARESGIKWITYGDRLENQDATIGYPHYDDGKRLGEAAGKWINEKLGGKADVALLGYEKASWGQQRGKGIREGLAATAPGAKIVAEQDAVSPSEGLNTTRTILQANPDLKVIVAIEDPAAEGAYKAWIASGRDKADPVAFIGGMDGTIPALKLLREGDNIYRASMAIPLSGVGKAIVDSSDKMLAGENTGDIIVPLELVTPGSPKAEAFLKEQNAAE